MDKEAHKQADMVSKVMYPVPETLQEKDSVLLSGLSRYLNPTLEDVRPQFMSSSRTLQDALFLVLKDCEETGTLERVLSNPMNNNIGFNLRAFWEAFSKAEENEYKKEFDQMSDHKKQILKKLLNKQ
jgi:hypothetical protein